MLGDHLDARVHPDWQADQAASVRDALGARTWVAVTDGTIAGFVNMIFDATTRPARFT